MFIAALFTTGQDMETNQVTYNRRVDKKAVDHVYNGILAIKINEILPFEMAWMDL